MKSKTIVLFLVLIQPFISNAQGKTTLLEGHHLAEVVLTSYGNTLTSKMPLKYAIPNRGIGKIPGYVGDYFEDDIKMTGIMSEAVLAIDWWTLFGEPTEQYIFTWLARDYYNLYVPGKYGVILKTVNKSMLQKYPDLLMRFEALKPKEVAFEIDWNFTEIDRELLSQTGYSYIPYYHIDSKFITTVSSTSILTAPSGKVPFAVPGIRQGKGEVFLGLPSDFPKEKVKVLMHLFAKSKHFYIQSVNITKIIWPIHEMKAILDLYEEYESGEKDPTPKELISKAEEKDKNLTAYNKNDFFGDAFEEEKVNIRIESNGSEKIVKNNNLTTFKTNQYYLDMFKDNVYSKPNNESKFLKMWSVDYNKFRQGYKHHITEFPNHIIDFKGNIISIDGKTKFAMIKNNKNEDGFYEALYFTDEWTYVRDVCYTAGSGGLRLDKIQINVSFNEAKTKLLNHKDSESGCTQVRHWKKYGVGKFFRYFLDDKLQVIEKKTEYHVIGVIND